MEKKLILYKKVSKEYKTQENTKNETLWTIGKSITIANWNPKESECGSGKFQRCANPIDCTSSEKIKT